MAAAFSTLGADTGTSAGLAVAAGSNTKGSYVEFTGSSAIAAKIIYAYFWPSGSSVSSYAIDIATGAAASETVRVGDLQLDAGSSQSKITQFIIPVDSTVFAAGTRIAVRAEGSSVAGTEEIMGVLVLCDTDLPNITSRVTTTYGMTLGGNVKGTVLDPGGTAHTKPGVVQIVATADSNVQWLTLVSGRNANGAMTDANGLMDVTGASDAVVIANLPVGLVATPDQVYPMTWGPFPGDNWQSAKIGVNGQCTIIDATDRIWTISATCLRGTVVSAGSGGAASLVNSSGLVG